MFALKRKNLLSVTRTFMSTQTSAVKPAVSVPSKAATAADIFHSALDAVAPRNIIRKVLKFHGGTLLVKNKQYTVNRNVFVVAFGKAVLGMVRTVEDILGDNIVSGVASVPAGIQETFRSQNKTDMLPLATSSIKVIEGAANNLPDSEAEEAANQILNLVEALEERHLLLVLISGGGSALLPSPVSCTTLEDQLKVTQLLSEQGATIQELNTVRKNIDLLKGGGLAEKAFPAQVISLILSDIVGDPLDLIASGPTVLDHSTPGQCLDLFKKYNIHDKIPGSIQGYLSEKAALDLRFSANRVSTKSVMYRPPENGNKLKSHVQNVIVGNNTMAIHAATERAQQLGYSPYILTTAQTGEARHVGALLAKLGVYICLSMLKKHNQANPGLSKVEVDIVSRGVPKECLRQLLSLAHSAFHSEQSVCIVVGGETTVTLKGSGKGGRNQEIALAAGIELYQLCTTMPNVRLNDKYSIDIMSVGSDGLDGPTEAAGAIADLETVTSAKAAGLDSVRYLENNDSYTFFHSLNNESQIITGHTGTNIMDLQLVLISPK